MKNLMLTTALFIGLTTAGMFTANSAKADNEPKLGGTDSTAVAIESEAPDGTAKIGQISLLGAAVCRGIENHAPVGSDTHFDPYVKKVWVYSQVKMDKAQTSTIKHVYFFNGKKISEVSLDVKGPTFRTYSYKTIHDHMVGDWKVEVTAEDGTVLETLKFCIDELGC